MNDRTSRRFVVLFHASSVEGDHFDLMIESDSSLATWRTLERPDSVSAGHPVVCIRIGDHRREYLEYEGPISGDRGHVSRHDEGVCTMDDLAHTSLTIRFNGALLKGVYVLERDDETTTDQWRLRLA